MTEERIFGSPELDVEYSDRSAAYVVISRRDEVAMVTAGAKYFLPGGRSLPGESPADTIRREVREELRREVRLLQSLGEVTQYFYAADDDRRYKMLAVFFVGEFTNEVSVGDGEHQLRWVPIREVEQACFHQSHAWAVRRALACPDT
ncbi:MAG: 8-oxo-dGTP diphosphatase [Acidobacteriota bacterium]|nr:8-oxo-dGTP diphosphatase [Acidobacteriota bacterium]